MRVLAICHNMISLVCRIHNPIPFGLGVKLHHDHGSRELIDDLSSLGHSISYDEVRRLLCCLPTPMTLASGGSPMFPLVVHQPASPSIWPAVQSLRRGLSTNPGATMWCVCGCS